MTKYINSYSGKWQLNFINEYIDSIYNVGIDESQKRFPSLKEQYLPNSLYKFYSPSIHSLINIENNILYLSSPKYFNDPFDSFIFIDDEPYIKYLFIQLVEKRMLITKISTSESFSEKEYSLLINSPIEGKYIPELGHSNDFRTMLYQIQLNKSNKFRLTVNSLYVDAIYKCKKKVDFIRNIPFKISCFSNFADELELGKNTTMWSHYAKEHTGFCVKYSTNLENIIYKDIISCGLFPVIYSSRVPKLTISDFKKINHLGESSIPPISTIKKINKSLITKSAIWNYEKEWRLIISEENEMQLSDNTIPFLNIEAIFLGCRIENTIKRAIVNFAENNNIKVFESKQNDISYCLDFFETNSKRLNDDEYYKKLYKYNRIKDESISRRKIYHLNIKFSK